MFNLCGGLVIIDYPLALAYGLKFLVSEQDSGPCPVFVESDCNK